MWKHVERSQQEDIVRSPPDDAQVAHPARYRNRGTQRSIERERDIDMTEGAIAREKEKEKL